MRKDGKKKDEIEQSCPREATWCIVAAAIVIFLIAVAVLWTL